MRAGAQKPPSEERRAAFLGAAGRELAASLDYEHTIATLARLVVPNLAEMCVIDIAEPDDTLRRVAIAHRNPEDEARFAPQTGTRRTEIPDALARILRAAEPHSSARRRASTRTSPAVKRPARTGRSSSCRW
jgi:hypothetical protein